MAISGPAAVPTERGFRGAGGSGLLAIWCAASVMPYASSTGTPKTDSSPAITGAGNAADDERMKRRR
jgi:hypothetical protein